MREKGFSLLEVMIAAVILLVIALGLIPLYARSIQSNVSGFDYTQVSNFAKSRAEEFLQYPWNSPRLIVPIGNNQLQITDFYSQQDHTWKPVLASGEEALFNRVTTVRQLGIGDITTPLAGGTGAAAVHVKEITVTVTGTRAAGGPLGPGKDIVIRVLKSQ